jgi:hypothetical protein
MSNRSKVIRLTPTPRLDHSATPPHGIILNIDARRLIHEELAAASIRALELEAAALKAVTEYGKAQRVQWALVERLNRLSRLAKGLPA